MADAPFNSIFEILRANEHDIGHAGVQHAAAQETQLSKSLVDGRRDTISQGAGKPSTAGKLSGGGRDNDPPKK